jgi:hypothetical protein
MEHALPRTGWTFFAVPFNHLTRVYFAGYRVNKVPLQGQVWTLNLFLCHCTVVAAGVEQHSDSLDGFRESALTLNTSFQTLMYAPFITILSFTSTLQNLVVHTATVDNIIINQ